MPTRDLQTVKSRFSDAEKHLESRHEQWKTYWKLYKSYTDENSPTISDLFIPKVFAIVETLMPRIVSAITGSNPIVSVRPRSADDFESAKTLESLFEYQLFQTNFSYTLIPIIRDALIMDIGVGKLQWKNDTVGSGDNEVTRYKGPNLSYISPFDIFPDPHARNKDDAKYIMHRYFVDEETLGQWQNEEKVGPEAGGAPMDDIDGSPGIQSDEDGQAQRMKSIGKDRKVDSTRDWVQIVEYWEDDWVIFMANESTIIRDEENPYDHNEKPFHFFADYPKGDEIFGQGEVENLEDLQHEINEKRNQRIDQVNLQLNPPIIKSPAAMMDDDELVFGPYEVWNAEPDDIQFPSLPDMTPPAVREEQMADQNMKETSAVTDVVQGVSNRDSPSTATGFRTLNENASSRFTLKVRSFEKPIREMATQMQQLNSQLLTGRDTIRIVGEVDEELEGSDQVEVEEKGKFKFLNFDSDDIAGAYDYIPQGAKSQTLKQRQQKLIQLINSVAPIASEINIKELFRELFRSFNVKDVDRFLEVPEDQRRRMAQQQGAGQRSEGRRPAPGENNEAPDDNTSNAAEEQSSQLGAQAGGLV